MRFLLDTHAFLWFIGGDNRLSPVAKQLITNIDNEVCLSIVSLWEIALKVSLQKLTLQQPFETLIPTQLAANEIEIISIDMETLTQLVTLPFHHRDPFDRLLIAQAITKKLPLISKDAAFASYPVERIW